MAAAATARSIARRPATADSIASMPAPAAMAIAGTIGIRYLVPTTRNTTPAADAITYSSSHDEWARDLDRAIVIAPTIASGKRFAQRGRTRRSGARSAKK